MTTADRDTLAAYFHDEVDECQFHNEPGHTPECERAADRFLASDWLAARDRAVAQQALRDAADGIQALHPGEVKASVVWLRDRADTLGEDT